MLANYNKEKQRWKDDCGGLYSYALYNCTQLSFSPYPYIFAHNFKEAMGSAAEMISEGIEEVEIGLPNGEIVQIDARYCDAEDATSKENDSENDEGGEDE